MVHTERIAVWKEGIKKSQTVRWCVSFTDNVIDGINSTIKFINEYADGKLSSICIDDIIKGILVEFKKINCTLMWHFY
jgi:hypothetical protein